MRVKALRSGRHLIAAFCGLVAILGAARAQNQDGPNLIPSDFESGTPTYNPWAGVDGEGHLHVGVGAQFATNNEGKVGRENFSASVAVGDLNGDGLPDLVVADSRGYFWFYPNSGKPGAPVFTHGEIMPIWLGTAEKDGAVVPRIQLIDYNNEGRLDLVAGNFLGELYYIHNQGTPTAPDFRMPDDRSAMKIGTHRDGVLWCNYLSPFLFSWSPTGRLDLLMGDGTYSANSIYLFLNQGTNGHPLFNNQYKYKIIPGLGREQLTPQVVDWEGNGKPDVICGERSGFVDLYLNKADKGTDLPEFNSTPQHVSFGGRDNIGNLATICVADLNQDKLFDLLTGTAGGDILYSQNIGTPGHPAFGPLTPLAGKNPFRQIVEPNGWTIPTYRPYGAPYELLQVVSPALEQGFTPPPGFAGQGALKFSVMDPHNVYFKTTYYPSDPKQPGGNPKRTIRFATPVTVTAGDEYKVSFWVRSDGTVTDLQTELAGLLGKRGDEKGFYAFRSSTIDVGPSWSQVSATLRIEDAKLEKARPGMAPPSGDVTFSVDWNGDGALYFDGFSLTKHP
jgi:hypothetical protein